MECHNAVIYGKVMRKKYYYVDVYKKILPLNECIKYEKIFEGELNIPILKNGDKIYIPDKEIQTTVEDIVISIDGTCIYYTDYDVKIIEDEETEKSKFISEKEKEEFEKMSIIISNSINKKWWQFWR